MPTLYVARSANLTKWAGDVGLGKFIFKVGVTDDDPAAVLARGCAGETDWAVMKKLDAGDLTQEQALDRIAAREKRVDPAYYPRVKGDTGIFKVNPDSVVKHLLFTRVMAGDDGAPVVKPKPADFATYLIRTAQG